MCAVDLSGRIFHRLLQDMADDLERHRPQRVQNILTAILKGDENAQPGMQPITLPDSDTPRPARIGLPVSDAIRRTVRAGQFSASVRN
jgi:hypothetical protein